MLVCILKSLFEKAEGEIKVKLAATVDATKIFARKPKNWKGMAC